MRRAHAMLRYAGMCCNALQRRKLWGVAPSSAINFSAPCGSSLPTPYLSKPGNGMRRSWFWMAVDTKTSPISAPRALKPPAVPALITRSGLKAWMARYAVSVPALVPTSATSNLLHLPLCARCTSRPPTLPENVRVEVGVAILHACGAHINLVIWIGSASSAAPHPAASVNTLASGRSSTKARNGNRIDSISIVFTLRYGHVRGGIQRRMAHVDSGSARSPSLSMSGSASCCIATTIKTDFTGSVIDAASHTKRKVEIEHSCSNDDSAACRWHAACERLEYSDIACQVSVLLSDRLAMRFQTSKTALPESAGQTRSLASPRAWFSGGEARPRKAPRARSESPPDTSGCPLLLVRNHPLFVVAMSKETLKFRGVLVGHSDWVTAIATPVDTASNVVISASRCALRSCTGAQTVRRARASHRRACSPPFDYGAPAQDDTMSNR
jgi:hypothetical protein